MVGRRFREFARPVGISNGEYLGGHPCQLTDGSADDWLRGWTEQAEAPLGGASDSSSHPVAGRIFIPDLIDDLIELGICGRSCTKTLDQLPQTFVITMSSTATCSYVVAVTRTRASSSIGPFAVEGLSGKSECAGRHHRTPHGEPAGALGGPRTRVPRGYAEGSNSRAGWAPRRLSSATRLIRPALRHRRCYHHCSFLHRYRRSIKVSS